MSRGEEVTKRLLRADSARVLARTDWAADGAVTGHRGQSPHEGLAWHLWPAGTRNLAQDLVVV